MAKTAAQTLIGYEDTLTEIAEQLTDSGDHTVFSGTAETWSGDGDYAPQILPDGIVNATSALIVTPGTAADTVDAAEFTAYFAGTETTCGAESALSTPRPSVSNFVIHIVTHDGTDYAVVTGTEGTSFSTTRGTAGGPPLIPVGSIQVAQVKMSSQTSAVVLASEISQSASQGTQERFDTPGWETYNLGLGNQTFADAEKNAHVKFNSALPLTHTANVPKRVYCVVNEPDYTTVQESLDWVPSEPQISATSTQKHRKTTNTTSESLTSASFNIYWNNPTTDALRKKEGRKLTFKVWPDQNITDEYELTQGYISFTSTNPVAADMGAAATVVSETQTVRFG